MRILGYLDPGSASVLLQALLGAIAALGLTARLWWGRLLTLLRIRRPEGDAEAAEKREERGSIARRHRTEGP